MSTLDLHGTKHAEVEDKLTRYFFWDQPGHNQYKIITGNSKKMQELYLNGLINTNISIIFHHII
jgi:hypothetical protein